MLFKKISSLFSCLIVLLLITVGCGSNEVDGENNANDDGIEGDGETITLKFASFAPPTVLLVKQGFEPFMERVTELTDGKVQFEFYPAEQMGKGNDLLKIAGDGVVDIAHVQPYFTPSEMPIGSTLMAIPGLYEDPTDASKALLNVSKQSPMLDTDFLKNGVRPVFYFVSPAHEVFTDGKEIKTPEDMRGLKIRTQGGTLIEALDFLNAAPMQVSAMDVYNAFSSGVINAVTTYTVANQDYAWDELTKFATRGLGLGTTGAGVVINENVFQDLPEDIQEAIMQAGEEASIIVSDAHKEKTDETYEEWAEDGMEIYELTENDKEQWQNVYSDFEAELIGKQKNEELSQVLEMFGTEMEQLE